MKKEIKKFQQGNLMILNEFPPKGGNFMSVPYFDLFPEAMENYDDNPIRVVGESGQSYKIPFDEAMNSILYDPVTGYIKIYEPTSTGLQNGAYDVIEPMHIAVDEPIPDDGKKPLYNRPIYLKTNPSAKDLVFISARDNNSPYVKAFRDAQNDVGNLAVALGLGPLQANMVGNLLELLAAGEYGTIIGGIAGGIVGSEFVDGLIRNATGGEVGSFQDLLMREGLWQYNAALMNPGMYAGGYAGSKFGYGILHNELLSGAYNMNPRMTAYRPNGEPVMLYPGETVTYPEPYTELPPGLFIGSTYRGQISNPRVGGNTRVKPHSVNSGSARTYGDGHATGKSTGSSTTPVRDVTATNGKVGTIVLENPEIPVTTAPWITAPNVGNIVPPPPPLTPPLVNEDRVVVEQEISDPWDAWFIQLRHEHPGTKQYWPGDPNSGHEPGWYLIVGGGKGDIITEQRTVATGKNDSRGGNRQALDSTTTTLKTRSNKNNSAKVVQGGVEQGAALGNTPYLPEEEFNKLYE